MSAETRTWTTAMSDEVARRLASVMGAPLELGEAWMQDGAAVLGMGRDDYAQWFNTQMQTDKGLAELADHCQDVLAYAVARL